VVGQISLRSLERNSKKRKQKEQQQQQPRRRMTGGGSDQPVNWSTNLLLIHLPVFHHKHYIFHHVHIF
jgi:hypothetical protein